MILENVTGTSCARWRAALERQAAGGAVATIACLGDSNTQDDTGLYMWHEVARDLLKADQPGVWDEGFAYFTAPTGLDASRRTFGTNWGIAGTGQAGPGLNATLIASGAGGTPFEYGPVTCDTFRLYFRRFGSGSFRYSIDGGAVSADQAVTGAGEVGYIDIDAGAAGAHTLKLHAIATGTQPQFLGVAWTTSTAPRRRIAATGRFGAGTDDWTSGVSLADVYEAIDPDLTFALIGSNDYGFHGLSTATTLANLSTWIDTAHAAGSDFVICVPGPSDYDPGAAVQPPADLVSGLHALAVSKDCPILDLTELFVSFAAATTAGYLGDHVHFTDGGHAVLGDAVRDAILAISDEAPGAPDGTWEPVIAERYDGADTWTTVVAERWTGTEWIDVTMERAV